MNRHYIIILILLFFGLGLKAQNITKVNAYQEGSNVIVTYHLDKATDIKVQVSTDGGKTYSKPLKKVSGDVGAGVKPGDKRIIWNALSEIENFGGDHIVFKVSPITASKIKFQNELSVGAGWAGSDPGGVSTSLIPLSVGYLGGVRISHIFIGAGVGASFNMATLSAEAKETALKANILSIDINATLRYYILKKESKVNPYLSASIGYSLGKEASFDQQSATHTVTGDMKTGGLFWAAAVGSNFSIGQKSAFSVNLGLKSFNMDYSYKAVDNSTAVMTQKISSAKMLVPTLSLGITF